MEMNATPTFMKKYFPRVVRAVEYLRQRLVDYSIEQENDRVMGDSSIHHIEKPKLFAHLLLIVAAAFIVIGLLWAKLAILDEVTRGEGKVIPSSQIQIIQNLEGGIVSKIYVKEGQVVDKGQVLMQLDATRFASTYQEALAKEMALRMKMLRLEAETTETPYVISADIEKKYPKIARQEKSLYESRRNELERMRKSFNIASRELKMMKPLVARGAASEVEVLQTERTANELQGQIAAFQSKALDDLASARAEHQAISESISADKDRVARTTVRSPVKGIVKQLKINTLGGVAQPGSDMVEIVPVDDTLLIEARVNPKDIGFVHIGQKAMVKISAYDFSIYGGLEGTVEQISADAIKDEKSNKDETYYLIRTRTKKNYLEKDGRQLNIIPGMHATVDILTGHKSVLDYILKPILKARENALRER